MSEETSIKIALKTGEVILGYKNSMKALRNNKAKMILTANNCPASLQDEINRLCKFGNITNRIVNKTSWDLGFICGRPHMVAVMAIVNPGDSDILSNQ
ncbi:MAG: 50S ribosomal protein L30e [Candidatus Lokiarchaeota archaeon]|nr:50S ribosomal protein L30e [Candidatus Lokiarchaeota archaeon]